MPIDSDYVIFVALLLAVLGAGLLRVFAQENITRTCFHVCF
jgi:hypothetical protein